MKVKLPGNLQGIFEGKNAREGGRGSLEAKRLVYLTARLLDLQEGESGSGSVEKGRCFQRFLIQTQMIPCSLVPMFNV